MTRALLNALQAILIRERLILCFEFRKAEIRGYSVRKLIEDIALSAANEHEARAYREDEDRRDEGKRFATGFALKQSTVDNLLSRRASALSADNLKLILNFLMAEGFVSPEALQLCREHPDIRLRSQFGGIAPTDARLQRYRRALEGEYHQEHEGTGENLWIAAPGRSKPFISLRAVAASTNAKQRAESADITLNLTHASARYEGRIFLMPGDALTLIEIDAVGKVWDGHIYRIAQQGTRLELLNDLTGSRSLQRMYPLGHDARGQPLRDAIKRHLARWRDQWIARRERERLLQAFSRISSSKSDFWMREKNLSFIEAAKTGTATDLIHLLAQGADINFRDPRTGRTATHWAAANNEPDKIYALACRKDDDEWSLSQHLPEMNPLSDALQLARLAQARRDPLITDSEGCFASALAPASTDNLQRNRAATAIWRYLMRIEADAARDKYEVSRAAFLELWQPSTVMREAASRFSATLPPGFTNPKAD